MSCEARQSPEEIHDLPTLQGRVVERLRRTLRDETLRAFFVAIDGLPGTGKSTVVRELAPALTQLDGLQHAPVSVDDFIATDRDSPLRHTMVKTPDPELFWRIFYSRRSLEYVLQTIASSNGDALAIPLTRKYDRPTGKVVLGDIKIPAGRKVVTVEGVNASQAVRSIFPENGDEQPFVSIMVAVDPAIALRRAVERDVAAGRRTAEEAYDYREKEYRHMVPQMERNQALADFVFVNGHDAL